mmetsp:Transcript_24919/g.59293  ORF Transcript_24919/g.59293 Transcript_24919/m.59293 type:complete len:222 (+) Transcript_24919:144-809(+)
MTMRLPRWRVTPPSPPSIGTCSSGEAIARATEYVESPPSPVSAQKSSHSSSLSAKCSYVNPSPSRPLGSGRLISAALVAACISRMSKRPRKILTEIRRSKNVLRRSALVPLNQATIGRNLGLGSSLPPMPEPWPAPPFAGGRCRSPPDTDGNASMQGALMAQHAQWSQAQLARNSIRRVSHSVRTGEMSGLSPEFSHSLEAVALTIGSPSSPWTTHPEKAG